MTAPGWVVALLAAFAGSVAAGWALVGVARVVTCDENCSHHS